MVFQHIENSRTSIIPETMNIEDKELWRVAAEGDVFAGYKIARLLKLPYTHKNFDRRIFVELLAEFYEKVIKSATTMTTMSIMFERYLEEMEFTISPQGLSNHTKEEAENFGGEHWTIWCVNYAIRLFGSTELFNLIAKKSDKD